MLRSQIGMTADIHIPEPSHVRFDIRGQDGVGAVFNIKMEMLRNFPFIFCFEKRFMLQLFEKF